MQERLPLEHGGELELVPTEELLDRGRVADKGSRKLEAGGRDAAHRGQRRVGLFWATFNQDRGQQACCQAVRDSHDTYDPFDEVRLVLYVD